MMNFDEMYDKLIELDIATEEEIKLVCCINGNNIDTLNDILYARTGVCFNRHYYNKNKR